MSNLVRPLLCTAVFGFTALTILATNCLCESSGNTNNKHINEIRKRAEQGYPEQQTELGEAYLMGKGVPQDLKQAANWYEKAARRGNPFAENQIGYFYQKGIGVRADPVRAFHWYQLASASGLIWGKVNLGVAYLYGMGVPKNSSTARRLLEEAAEKGNGRAAGYLGHMEYFGMAGPVDKAAAEKWFAAGAKLHDPEAAYDLALLFTAYDDHPRDLHRAVELLRFSSSKGHVLSKHVLGRLLTTHPELADSDEESFHLLKEASAAGIWKSTAVLGVLSRDGRGTARDDSRAYYYFTLSALQGGDVARTTIAPDLQSLETRLPEADRAAAEAKAREWFHQHPKPTLFLTITNERDIHYHMAALADPSGQTSAGD